MYPIYILKITVNISEIWQLTIQEPRQDKNAFVFKAFWRDINYTHLNAIYVKCKSSYVLS